MNVVFMVFYFHCVKILNLYNYIHHFDFCPFRRQLLWFWNQKRCQSDGSAYQHKMPLWIGSINLRCDSLGKKRTAACEVWTLIKFHSHSRLTVISNIPLGNIDANCTLAIFCLCSLFCLVDHIWGRWRMISSFRADKESNGMQLSLSNSDAWEIDEGGPSKQLLFDLGFLVLLYHTDQTWVT